MIIETILIISLLFNLALLIWICCLKDDKDELHSKIIFGTFTKYEIAGWHNIEKAKIMNTLKRILKRK